MINKYNYEVLSREELERNFKLMKDNNIEVRETIILHNIKLVFYRYYKRFSNTNMNMEDIVAYGMIGLIKAVDAFRLDKKCTFTTYASKCIDNEIQMKNYFNTKLQMTILIGTSIVALSMVAVYKNAVARYLLALMMFVLLVATRKKWIPELRKGKKV